MGWHEGAGVQLGHSGGAGCSSAAVPGTRVGDTHLLPVLQVQQPGDELALPTLWSLTTKEQKAEPAAPSLSTRDV